tara:strand:- start:823 stop:1647 length:825 start_codon:yes stop_codon:yes gene_type:complete
MNQDAEVTVEYQNQVAVIRLSRPDRLNAWNNKISAGLDGALQQATEDQAVRSVIITGNGRAFCAGADLSGGGDTFDPDRTRDPDDRSEERTPQFLPIDVNKPVIAAINGPAVGVGATYPLLCDIRIASQSARIGFVFNRIGMLPELGSHSLLPRIVGFSNAAQLLLGGEIIDANTALSMGLVSQVYPDEDLLDQAIALAERLSVAAPVSVAASKRLLWEGLSLSWEEMHNKETPIFNWVAQQPDSVEGVTAFLEKRTANWSMDPSSDLPKELFD